VGDDSHFLFRQKMLGEDGSVRRDVVMVKQPGLFSPKFTARHEPGVHIKFSSSLKDPQYGLIYKWFL
jgi:hypothetical protein